MGLYIYELFPRHAKEAENEALAFFITSSLNECERKVKQYRPRFLSTQNSFHAAPSGLKITQSIMHLR